MRLSIEHGKLPEETSQAMVEQCCPLTSGDTGRLTAIRAAVVMGFILTHRVVSLKVQAVTRKLC